MTAVAERYARALFNQALEHKQLDAIAQDLEKLSSLMRESSDFKAFLRNPLVARQESANVMAEIAKKNGFADLTQRFLGLLARHRRLSILGGAIKKLELMIVEQKGILAGEVLAPLSLKKGQMMSLKEALEKKMEKKVELRERTDPAILGGVVIRVGPYLMDFSLNTKLNKLQKVLKGQI